MESGLLIGMKLARISSMLVVLFLFLADLPVRTFSFANPTERQPIRAQHAMVASTSENASRVGVEIMRRGGNAVDAAIAVAFALAVVHPAAGNLGGGGFMMVRLKDGRTVAIDYREAAPAAAHRDVYLDARGNLKNGEGGSLIGYRAPGVPGTVRGLELALKKYGSGRLSWSQLIEPAYQLAANGFVVNARLAGSLREHKDHLSRYSGARRIYFKGEQTLREGELFRQADLARTLQRLQLNGPDEMYGGQTARAIAKSMKDNKGLISAADLRTYFAKEREAVRGLYRGFEIVSMPPPSSGGAILIEMLNVLEGYDLTKFDWGSADRHHLLAETMRRAFADRAEHFGDADFVKVPLLRLIDKKYAAELRKKIDLTKATPSEHVRADGFVANESEETTHFAVVDKEGNAVANTYTLNNSYGSGVVIEGTGILMNNEMDDFAVQPGKPNLNGLTQGEKNAIAPRKRPLSSMAPTFVLRKDGSLWFTVGSPGGPTIINTLLQVIINVVDYEMNIQQAIDAPRIHHQWLPDAIRYEPFGLSGDTRNILLARGQKFSEPSYMGDAQGIVIESGTNIRLGATDPRLSDGLAVGY